MGEWLADICFSRGCGNMTQDEPWQLKYQEVVDFIETNKFD